MPRTTQFLAPTGRLAATNHLNLAISLPLRNQAALSNLLQQIYDPSSPNYHHYLTPQQFTEQFGPTKQDYDKVVAFAKAHGLKITATHPNHVLLDVSATVPTIEKAFNIQFNTFQHPTEKRAFYAPNTEPALDLDVPVLHISGLDNFSLPRPHLKMKPLGATGTHAVPNVGSSPNGGYIGKDFRKAYAPDTTLMVRGRL